MKLSSDLKKSLAAYTADLKGDISITLQKGSHNKRDDLVTFLSDVCSVSSRLNLQENDNFHYKVSNRFIVQTFLLEIGKFKIALNTKWHHKIMFLCGE